MEYLQNSKLFLAFFNFILICLCRCIWTYLAIGHVDALLFRPVQNRFDSKNAPSHPGFIYIWKGNIASRFKDAFTVIPSTKYNTKYGSLTTKGSQG